MKHVSLVINVVLGIAIAVLYFLHFTATGVSDVIDAEFEERGDYLSGSRDIVYVNFDTLLNNYDMFFDLQKEFVAKQQRMESELTNKSRSYETQVVEYQDRAQKGLITRSQAQQREMELMQLQQELMEQRDEFQQELMEEEQVMNRQLQHSIYDFLEEYNRNLDYQYILSHTFGGPILYTDKNLNITKEVIEGLNKKYSENQRR